MFSHHRKRNGKLSQCDLCFRFRAHNIFVGFFFSLTLHLHFNVAFLYFFVYLFFDSLFFPIFHSSFISMVIGFSSIMRGCFLFRLRSFFSHEVQTSKRTAERKKLQEINWTSFTDKMNKRKEKKEKKKNNIHIHIQTFSEHKENNNARHNVETTFESVPPHALFYLTCKTPYTHGLYAIQCLF